MPTFFPKMQFQEEGCYILQNENTPFVVVSPDGSIKLHDDTVYGVEIKCPFPGKVHTVDVIDELPRRYVIQVLMEMKVLCVEKLLFVCWLPETTSVIEVTFSHKLWDNVWRLMLASETERITQTY